MAALEPGVPAPPEVVHEPNGSTTVAHGEPSSSPCGQGKLDTLSEVACCIKSCAVEIIEGAGLPKPKRCFVDSRGEDLTCEDCDELSVWTDGSTPHFGPDGNDKCTGMRDVSFVMLIGRCVSERPPTKCDEHEDSCPEPIVDESGCQQLVLPFEPLLQPPCCRDENGILIPEPTRAQITAFMWRQRWALEKELEDALMCCLAKFGHRCEGVSLEDVIEDTEGGCDLQAFRLTVTL